VELVGYIDHLFLLEKDADEQKHIGAGVRYNARKQKVGNYYSTPIFGFKCKCHLCDGWFEIRTDPKVHLASLSKFYHRVVLMFRTRHMKYLRVRRSRIWTGTRRRMEDLQLKVSFFSPTLNRADN
jgi:hypothetical protein